MKHLLFSLVRVTLHVTKCSWIVSLFACFRQHVRTRLRSLDKSICKDPISVSITISRVKPAYFLKCSASAHSGMQLSAMTHASVGHRSLFQHHASLNQACLKQTRMLICWQPLYFRSALLFCVSVFSQGSDESRAGTCDSSWLSSLIGEECNIQYNKLFSADCIK